MNRRDMIRAMGAGAAAVALSEGRAFSAPGPGEAPPANVPATRASPEALRKLPTSIRPIVDEADVLAPEGYRVEPVLVGLNFPCGMDVADDGSVFIIEGGCTWPTRPVLPPRVLRFIPSGTLEVFAEEEFAPRGVACRGDAIYVSLKGGYHSRFVRYDRETRARKVIVDGLPDGGWHEPGGPVFGPDGRMYIAQGSVTLHGAVEPAGFTVDVAKHPYAFDVPGQDVTLTGNNISSRDPTAPFPYLKETGPFKPFGVPARRGEVIPGQLKCSTGVWRCQPDGSELELLAWGIRNPYGLAINEAGELYASDNDFEEKGDRSIAEDPDRIWLIRNSRASPGSVRVPDWYGFPDLAADGLPVWHERHRPLRGTPAEPFLLNPPPWAGPPAVLFEPHTGLSMMDFCPSDAFGARGELFVALFGTYAPLNSPRPSTAASRSSASMSGPSRSCPSSATRRPARRRGTAAPAGWSGRSTASSARTARRSTSSTSASTTSSPPTSSPTATPGSSGASPAHPEGANIMTGATADGPILVELDAKTWGGYLDSVEAWLGNTLMAQATYRQLAEDSQEKVIEPHFKEFLGSIAATAGKHERQAEAMFRMIGRDPARARRPAGNALAKVRQAWADLQGEAGGAEGPFRDLHQLFLASLNAISAFSVVEQLGYALGNRELATTAFGVVSEQGTRHLQIQEMLLELAAMAILYKRQVTPGPSMAHQPVVESRSR